MDSGATTSTGFKRARLDEEGGGRTADDRDVLGKRLRRGRLRVDAPIQESPAGEPELVGAVQRVEGERDCVTRLCGVRWRFAFGHQGPTRPWPISPEVLTWVPCRSVHRALSSRPERRGAPCGVVPPAV